MLLSIFNWLYELIGNNPDYPEYKDGIFNSVGLASFMVAILLAIVFYILLGRWKEIWYTTTHWILTIILTGIICFLIALFIGSSTIGVYDGYLVTFSFLNSFYGIVIFIASSFLFKRFSIYAKQTPRLK